MKKIYFIDIGESVDKISKISNSSNLKKENDLIFDKNYVVTNQGVNDIIKVENYRTIYEYVFQPDDSMLDIMARGFEIKVNNDVNVGDKILLEKPSSIRYVVKPTDTIEIIANKFSVNIEDIVNSNYLKSDKLFIGQVLWI